MSIKGRMYPRRDMHTAFDLTFSHCRLIVNLAVEQQKYYSPLRKPPTAKERSRQLTELKAEFDWLRKSPAPAVALQQALKDYEQGLTNFFEGRANKPTFKSYSKGENSFRVTGKGNIKIRKLSRTKYEVHIPKIGWCKVTLPRELPISKVTSYTVSMTRSGKYHISFNTIKPVNTKKTKSKNPKNDVAIDLGCAKTITLSTG